MVSELQTKGGVEDNTKIIFPISQICCPSGRDGSYDGSQNMFMENCG